MMPPTNLSPEQQESISRDNAKIVLSLRTKAGRRKHIPFTIKMALFLTLIGSVVSALVALGQSQAVGFTNAWQLYKWWWLIGPAAGLGATLLFLGYILVDGYAYLSKKRSDRKKSIHKRKKQTESPFEKLLFFVVTIFFVLFLLGAPIYFGYREARDSNRFLADPDTGNLMATSRAIEEQSDALRSLADRSYRLLEDLDKTEAQVRKTKIELSETLVSVETHICEVRTSQAKVDSLLLRQAQIEARNQELARLLDGKRPITQEDLARSGRRGLSIGVLAGFIASVLASMAASRIMSFIRRKR